MKKSSGTFFLVAVILFVVIGCSIKISPPQRTSYLTGTEFYKTAFPYNWQQRDSFVLDEFDKGNIPRFLISFVPVKTTITDSLTGRIIHGAFYVAPDYLCIGTDKDWARIHITPKAAQRIADKVHCFLPTKKMVDAIYEAAIVKLEPVPIYAFRDSTPTMYQHNLIIEGQRKGKKGLIGGIQKDVIITDKLTHGAKPDRVAIYGWHLLNGKPIQPVYTGHIFWWVDYSQGIRLVYEKMKVNGKWMNYHDVLKDPVLRRLICDEEFCDCYRYSY
jgi:hypothetical protein